MFFIADNPNTGVANPTISIIDSDYYRFEPTHSRALKEVVTERLTPG